MRRNAAVMKAIYPTREHERAASATVEFLAERDVDAVLLTASCARGQASRDSDVDIAVLVPPEMPADEREGLLRDWRGFYERGPVFDALLRLGQYTEVDLELIDGRFVPRPSGWTSGPDSFELEIGNTLVYVVPLLERTDRFARLRDDWTPYYPDALRTERLAAVTRYFVNNLEHVRPSVARGLYFAAFQRVWHACQEFLQALFISRRTYPIAYNKWIREQVAEILGLPELYEQLPRLFEIGRFETGEIAEKAAALRNLFERYVTN